MDTRFECLQCRSVFFIPGHLQADARCVCGADLTEVCDECGKYMPGCDCEDLGIDPC